MKKFVMGFVAVSALAASTVTPASAGGTTQAQGLWTFDFANEKVCRSITVTAGANTIGGGAGSQVTQGVGAATVRVVNTDNTSEFFVLAPGFLNPNEAIYKALIAACDHADDNSAKGFHHKSYLISVTGTGSAAAGALPANFGGVVGNLPTAGTPNAGTPGFILSITVPTNN